MNDKSMSAAELKALQKIMNEASKPVDAKTLEIVLKAGLDRMGKK